MVTQLDAIKEALRDQATYQAIVRADRSEKAAVRLFL